MTKLIKLEIEGFGKFKKNKVVEFKEGINFITGLNEGVIPNKVRGTDTIEAQRRLLFVGMTRALKRLYMISTVEWEGRFVNKVDKSQFVYNYWKKKYYGKTSRFVEEMKK